MDTPERNRIPAPPGSKFEDSPVFNYINSLSPIPPVRSTHIAQSFNSLSFSSPPSVFTSPHVSSHKESRFLKRHQNPDSSKPDFSSQKDGNVCSKEGDIDSSRICNSRVETQENLVPEISVGESLVEPSSEHSESAIEGTQTMTYGCGNPNVNPTTGVETNRVPESADVSTSLVLKAPEKPSSNGEDSELGTCHAEQEKEEIVYEWESLISDATDLLIFNSPENAEAFKELMQKSVDRGTRFCTSNVSQCQLQDMNNVQTTLHVDPDGSIDKYGEGPSSQPGEAIEIQIKSSLANTGQKHCTADHPNDKANIEPVSNLHRGMRRRCLDFEMASTHRKSLGGGLICKSSLLSQFEEKIASSDQSVTKPGVDSLRRILPGIGLHLNALATTSKDYKSLKCEISSSGRQIINLSSSIPSFDSPTAIQETVPRLLSSSTAERDTDAAAEDELQITEDASGVSSYLLSDELNQSSPKRKRRRLEQETESENSCKRCNCKKSKCLKLYCECFAAGVYCIEPCSCQDCFNKPIHEDTVLATRKQIESRNPMAFAPKVIRSSDSIPEIGVRDESSKTPASARHKRGCNCKKSSCLKKYCECFQGGVGCSINCRCEGCKNTFGRKDGCTHYTTEVEQEESESEISRKNVADKALQKTEIQSNDEHNSTSVVPMTPLQHLYRPLIQMSSSSSNNKPPRCSFPAIGSTSGSFTSTKFGRPSIILTQSKSEKQPQTSREGEMPEILQEKGSPNSSAVKTGSPNSKRVSPPHCNLGSSSSPVKRSGRKLILQSIPSFPSLTPQH